MSVRFQCRSALLQVSCLGFAVALAACPKPQVPDEDPRAGGSSVQYDKVPVENTPRAAPATRSSDVKAAQIIADAATASAATDWVEGRRLYWQVIARYEGTQQADVARVRLGQDAVARGDHATARELASAVKPQDDSRLEYARTMVLAQSHEAEKSLGEALTFFQTATRHADEPAAKETAALGIVRTAFFSAQPDVAEKAVFSHLVSDPGKTRARLIEIVEPLLTAERLAMLYETMPTSSPWATWIALVYAQDRCSHADPERCGAALTRVQAASPPADWAEIADDLSVVVRAWRSVRPRTIGVLLPLSGKYAGIGGAARDAIALVHGDDAHITLIYADTGGDAVQAASAARALILDDHVSAILGPIGVQESTAAVEVTARFGVPHIVLTSAEPVADEGPSVIRLRLSAREEAQAIARHAMQELALKRVGILYPETATGQARMGAFWDEVVRLGGEVWAVESYASDTTDYGPTLQRLVTAKKPTEVPGESIAFDALFIPDRAPVVRSMAPYLKFWGIPLRTSPNDGAGTIQLLGTAGWNDPRIIDFGESLTNNAMFVDAFYHDPDDPTSDAFARQFFLRYKRAPRTFHAEVHDATLILLRAVRPERATDHSARRAILARIMQTRNFPGATGLISILEGGAVLRRPRILTVDGDLIRPRLSEEEERAVQLPGGDGPR
ncbi:MAG: branched-chain amino acid transport system substrate-binding protein [Myxococcota bacterium]|jgi:branched-chain amino acid transport system substrate-binding protein